MESNVQDPREPTKNTGRKNQSIEQFSSLDPAALLELCRVAGLGAEKYGRLNYMGGYDWNLSVDAMMRHLLKFWGGQDLDDESGCSHLAHAAWHALTLLAFTKHGIGTDNRFKP